MAPGRKRHLPSDEIRELLGFHWNSLFIENKPVGPSNPIWAKLAEQVSSPLSGRHLYTIVIQNRYDVWPPNNARNLETESEEQISEQEGDGENTKGEIFS